MNSLNDAIVVILRIVIIEVRVPALSVALHVALHVVAGSDHQLPPV